MTFTDDFVVSAWVKLNSYNGANNSSIATRYNGTSGFEFRTNLSGQVEFVGRNAGSANFSLVVSSQSVPLNKWVHITAQLDMSAFTATATTSYVMIDGTNVPASVSRGGTNPTALIQAGNFEIGAQNSGAFPFPGKIAQVAIYSAKVTQATIKASMNQTLSGSETSLISAYSFNGVINDLNTTNANNLTANGGALATSADTPFTQTVSGITAGTTNYSITTAISSDGLTETVQVPEGDTIPTSGGVSAVSYSTQKVPYGFPASRNKWQVEWHSKATQTLTASNNTWSSGLVNGSLAFTAPLGEWAGSFDILHYNDRGATVYFDSYVTLLTANNSESDPTWTSFNRRGYGSGTTFGGVHHVKARPLSVSSATTYYIVAKSNSSDGTTGNNSLMSSAPSIVTLELAYL